MLQSIFLDSLILFLLIYALLDLFVRLSDFLLEKFSKVPQIEHYTLVFLKANEELLEAKLRPLLQRCEQNGTKLLAVDCGTGRKETDILMSLSAEYPCLLMLSEEAFAMIAEQKGKANAEGQKL